MFIAHVEFKVSHADRPKVLAVLTEQAPTVRSMKGCKAFIPFVDPTRDEGVGVMHEWESRTSFDAYLQSDAFLESGRNIRPLMLEPPVSKRFDVVQATVSE